MKNLGVRWTVGKVSARGFEALRLSIQSVTNLLPGAQYVVCVNTVSVAEAQHRVGSMAGRVDWMASDGRAPEWLLAHLAPDYAEGVAWKFAPVRLFPGRFELSLDNDIVLWELPPAIPAWLGDSDSFLIAEDVAPAFGQFSDACGPAPRNSGIRGLPPNYDFEAALHGMLARDSVVLRSELDEQGLQVATVTQWDHHVVRVEDVTICSPFPPHLPHLGRCGAHFVGLNAKRLPWSYEGRPGELYLQEHWDRWLPELERRVQATEARTTLV